MKPMEDVPKGVWVPAAFFAAGGLLEIALAAYETPRPWPFWPLWEALGRAAMHFLLALGLWQRIALARSTAMVYCLAIVPTYVAAIVLAYSGAPFRFPPHVRNWNPSCFILFKRTSHSFRKSRRKRSTTSPTRSGGSRAPGAEVSRALASRRRAPSPPARPSRLPIKLSANLSVGRVGAGTNPRSSAAPRR